MAGKTGADAVSKFLGRICRTITRYRNKLHAIIVLAESSGVITNAQATLAHAFVEDAANVCAIFELIAEFNSITP